MTDIFSPEEFINYLNSDIFDFTNYSLILFDPFDEQSIKIIEKIIAQLTDVFF
jgi:hypothetical protein